MLESKSPLRQTAINYKKNNQIDQVRDLLLGQERSRLDAVEQYVFDEEAFTKKTAKNLIAIIKASQKQHDFEFNELFKKICLEAFLENNKESEEAVISSLFPILLPAIKKSIQMTISKFAEDINSTFERAFSPEGIKWRIQAMKSNKSLGEVVFMHTMEYQVEEVFWIHQSSGSVLSHISSNTKNSGERGPVGSMLKAIQDYVKHSFNPEAGQGHGMSAVEIGDITLVIEGDAQTLLAIAVRGPVKPSDYPFLKTTKKMLFEEYGSSVQEFKGDLSAFKDSQRILAKCLRSKKQKKKEKGKKFSPFSIIVAVLLLGGGLLVGRFVQKEIQVSQIRKMFHAVEGVYISDIKKIKGQYVYEGFRDKGFNPKSYIRQHDLDISKHSFERLKAFEFGKEN